MFKTCKCMVLLLVVAVWGGRSLGANLPPGFSETPVGSGWDEVVGITFAADGRMFAWERVGKVYAFHNNQWQVVFDISQEVGAWRDHGLLAVALHPNFLTNGQIFVMYTVDRHHLLYFGTPQYNPNANAYFNATIVRVTRFTLDSTNNFLNAIPGSRLVLVGETKSTGIPILFESHGSGTLAFGSDGTLFVSCGDGASFVGTDTGGGDAWSYAAQALADGIIRPAEDVGAFRAQLVNCHNGKILRINPNNGNGLPGNPFFDPVLPRAPKSRVWALGLRNPYRISLIPGTGSTSPTDANPGVLCIGDVGWGFWEEINVCNAAGMNFGWPLYEGMDGNAAYYNSTVYNKDAPNPLFNQGGCTQQFFLFRELVHPDTLDPNPYFPNSCNPNNQIPASIPRFIHKRPSIDWGNPSGPARAPIFSGDTPTTINVGAPGSPISGPQFGGNCSIGGVWYTGTQYPQMYQNTYFHAEYGAGWIQSIVFNASHKPVAVQPFLTGGDTLIGMAKHPITGDLYYVNWTGIYKITYSPTQQPPTAVAAADVYYGPTPLTVQFSSEGSSDPQSQTLQFHWDFGDGATSTAPNPTHIYNAAVGVPTRFDVYLTVTNQSNLQSQAHLIISLNNTPPDVTVLSPAPGTTLAIPGNLMTYHLTPSVTDAEHDPSELFCKWQVTLHHDDHTHPEPPDSQCATTATLTPIGCDGEMYFYRLRLTVTDAAGLTGTDFVDVYPHCGANQSPIANNDAALVSEGGSTIVNVLANDSDADGSLNPASVVVVVPPAHGSTSVNPVTGEVTYAHVRGANLQDSFGYTVNDAVGGTSNVATVALDIEPVTPGDVNADGVVNVSDLLAVISAWGNCPPQPQSCPADVAPAPSGDGLVNVADLLMVISNWG